MAPPPLLPSIEHLPSPNLFSSTTRGQKGAFKKIFDINCWSLARDQIAEEIDLSFAGCQCPPAVKANREWQQELLNTKLMYMVETIPLTATLFCDPNFLLYPRHTLNLAKKLELKTKSLKVDIVKERIGQIWVNRIITELDAFFTNNLNWWQVTAVIFAQPTGKNVKK